MEMIDYTKEPKPTNVSITMSVGGLRNLVSWLVEFGRDRDRLSMTWEEDEKKDFDNFLGFLRQVLQGRENQI